MPINVAVVGAGSWGTTVAALAAENTPTVLWARRQELADAINRDHVNADYLAQYTLPEALHATSSLADAVAHADVLVMAVPSHGFREVAAEAARWLRPWASPAAPPTGRPPTQRTTCTPSPTSSRSPARARG